MAIDRTSLNLVSLIVGSAGLLTALTGFNVPQLRESFYGDNPYLLKRDIIASVMDWIFGGLAVAALIVQLLAEIAGPSIEERLYTTASYARVTALAAAATGILVWALTKMGRRLAARRWRPLIVDRYREMLERAAFVLTHDGLFPEHFQERERFSDGQNAFTREKDLSRVDEHLNLIDDLLELAPIIDRIDRVRRLQEVFAAAPPAA
jgi:hypothetical protein